MKKTTSGTKQKGQGYLRFHQQLTALKKNDFYTVKKLAKEARNFLAASEQRHGQMMLMSF